MNCAKLGVADRAVGDGVPVQQLAVPRHFVVVGEALARMANLDNTVVTLDELQCRRLLPPAHVKLRIGGLQRVDREQMLDVGQQQFLMLLFVMQAQCHQHGKFGIILTVLQMFDDRIVDALAKTQHLLKRRSAEQTALGTRMHRANRLVVGIEQVAPFRMQWLPRRDSGKNELLEEPGRMRQVPFHRTGIGHGLDNRIFRRQWRRQLQGAFPDPGKARRKIRRRVA